MLVLSRKSDESIIINGNIEVRVTKIEGDVVKLGISAPREISIYRKEIVDAIQESNQEASLKGKKPSEIPSGLLKKLEK